MVSQCFTKQCFWLRKPKDLRPKYPKYPKLQNTERQPHLRNHHESRGFHRNIFFRDIARLPYAQNRSKHEDFLDLVEITLATLWIFEAYVFFRQPLQVEESLPNKWLDMGNPWLLGCLCRCVYCKCPTFPSYILGCVHPISSW